MEERAKLTVMGVELGTYTTWDELDVGLLQFMGFEPLPSTGMMPGVLTVNHETGTLSVYGFDNGTPTTREYLFVQILTGMAAKMIRGASNG